MSVSSSSFVLVKYESMDDFALKIFGKEGAEGIKQLYPNSSTVHLSIFDNKISYEYTIGDYKVSNVAEFDVEFDEKTYFQHMFKTVVTKYSDTQFNYVSTTFDGKKFTRSFILSSEGLTINFSEPQFGLTGTLFYKNI